MLTNLSEISINARYKEKENDRFTEFLRGLPDEVVDIIVQRLNAEIAPKINCMECASCCKTLMIEVSENELKKLQKPLNKTLDEIKSEFIEEGLSGKMILNTIPCKFLKEKACTIYENRFSPCSEFPHLHRNGFKKRLFTTFMYYEICPIIYNVVEEMKSELNFCSDY